MMKKMVEALLPIFSDHYANVEPSEKHYGESVGYRADSKVDHIVETLWHKYEPRTTIKG